MRRVALVVCLALAGCGGSDEPAAPVPVAQKPLEGTVGGKAFAAKTALATRSFGDDAATEKFIAIYDIDVACFENPPHVNHILTSVEWKAGTAYDFDTKHNATFVIDKNGDIENDVIFTGRIEVVEAPPEKNGLGKLRLRGKFGSDSVEGEVTVKVCE